jgi:hypothetical protein
VYQDAASVTDATVDRFIADAIRHADQLHAQGQIRQSVARVSNPISSAAKPIPAVAQQGSGDGLTGLCEDCSGPDGLVSAGQGNVVAPDGLFTVFGGFSGGASRVAILPVPPGVGVVPPVVSTGPTESTGGSPSNGNSPRNPPPGGGGSENSVQPVPEPGTVSLLAISVGVMSLVRRRMVGA